MFDEIGIEAGLLLLEVPVHQPAIFREVDQHRSGHDPHGGDSRMIFVDGVLELVMGEGVIIIRANGQPERFIRGCEFCEVYDARQDHAGDHQDGQYYTDAVLHECGDYTKQGNPALNPPQLGIICGLPTNEQEQDEIPHLDRRLPNERSRLATRRLFA